MLHVIGIVLGMLLFWPIIGWIGANSTSRRRFVKLEPDAPPTVGGTMGGMFIVMAIILVFAVIFDH